LKTPVANDNSKRRQGVGKGRREKGKRGYNEPKGTRINEDNKGRVKI